MTSNNSHEVTQAATIALQIPPLRGKVSASSGDMEVAVDIIMGMLPYGHLSRSAVLKAVQSRLTEGIEDPAIALDGDSGDHLEWLDGKRAEIDWSLWTRYRGWLSTEQGRGPHVLNPMETSIDDVLRRLEDPDRPGRWDRRGLVVGDIQSGKTGHYIGLINKAIASGYKIVIVLAGMNNSLRSQTQVRLDEGLYGYESETASLLGDVDSTARLGVGMPSVCSNPGDPVYYMFPLTNRGENGDFGAGALNQHPFPFPPPVPLVFVAKKNGNVLRNLYNWLQSKLPPANPDDPESRPRLTAPMLLVDDEADLASINTKSIPKDENGVPDLDANPTAINRRIRQILALFSKNAMVGYTATPFANFFIPDESLDVLEDDLFPRDFIVSLQSPNTYVGPSKIMGLEDDPDGLTYDSGPLRIMRQVEDSDMLEHTTKDFVVAELPESLKEAVRAFLLSCAARDLRGQLGEHNSMLVHVTRYVNVQDQVKSLVELYVTDIRNRLESGEGDHPVLLPSLKEMWEKDFMPTTEWVRAQEPDITGDAPDLTWSEVQQALKNAVSKIQVREINGTANDSLIYKDYKDGLSVIAVGGDKLSRGLTLEGLTVNYFLRTAKQYDTLLQMGRWFGYRPGYLDLCRIYTVQDLAVYFTQLAGVEKEVREQLADMARQEKTPREFGLYVRQHPGGLLASARNKMRHGITMRLTYSGANAQSVAFPKKAADISANYQRLHNFLEDKCPPDKIETPSGKNGNNYIFNGVSGKDIADFIWSSGEDRIISPDTSYIANPECISRYICNRLSDNELTSWTVALINNSGGKQSSVGTWNLGLTRRKQTGSNSQSYSIKTLISPLDELLDLVPAERALAEDRTLKEEQDRWELKHRMFLDEKGKDPGPRPLAVARPSAKIARDVRKSDRGLLIIYPLDPTSSQTGPGLPEGTDPVMGWAVSFPRSPGDPGINYVVNAQYWNQEFGESNESD